MQVEDKLRGQDWLAIVLFAWVGQLAWAVENMYFNLFLYNTISTDSRLIAWMVAASAVVASLTTILMGAVSDRCGKRKPFLVWGYLLWGLSTWCFSWLQVERISRYFPSVSDPVLMTGLLVIILDCVMTFFGSTANDAAFNAWVTEITPTRQRAFLEGILSAFPLLAMLFIFGALDPLTQAGHWVTFFTIVAGITSLTGLLGCFFLQEKPGAIPQQQGSWWDNLIYGFKPAHWRSEIKLSWAFVLLLVISTANQVYMPYLIIYIQTFLKIENYPLILAVVLLSSAGLSVVAGKLFDKFGKLRSLPPVLILAELGLIAMYFARGSLTLALAGILLISGNLFLVTIATALIRSWIPSGRAGSFQGVRMVFAVMLPMILGPGLGSLLIRRSNAIYKDLGQIKQVPTPAIFLGGALVLLLACYPYWKLKKLPGSTK